MALPNPIANCGRCLYRLGYGYDRVGRRLKVTKNTVAKWVKVSSMPLDSIDRQKVYYRIQQRQATLKRELAPPKVLRRPKHVSSLRRLKKYLRRKLWIFFKHGLHPKSTAALVGCTRSELIDHLRKQFTEGMTLENYPAWEIDHIKPCSRFDLFCVEQRKQCFHYSNLQPLWKSMNRRLSDKLESR